MAQIGTVDISAEGGTLSKEMMDQLALLIGTPTGTVVLDREFGVDTACIDMPPEEARTMLAAELAVKIERYIPGLTLGEVKIEQMDAAGNLRLKVVVSLDNG